MRIDQIRKMTEDEVKDYFEKLRWPDGKKCVFCFHDRLTTVTRQNNPRDIRIRCLKCRKQFTVTSGTLLHGTRIPLKKWLLAYYLIKKGTTCRKLKEDVGVTYKVAYSFIHRMRGMELDELFHISPMIGNNAHQKYFLAMDMCLNWFLVKSEYRVQWFKKVNDISDMSENIPTFYAEKIGENPSAVNFFLDDGIEYFYTLSQNGLWYLVMSRYRDKYKEKPENDEVLNVCVGDTVELIDFYLKDPTK